MSQNKFSLIIKYGLIVCLIIPPLNEVLGQSEEIQNKPTFSDLTNSKNNQIITDISEGWQLIIPTQNLSSTVSLPLLVSQELQRITFSKTFQIPESFRNHKLIIWFPGIYGMVDINLNNIEIIQNYYIPSGLKVQIPANLLNIGGENILDIAIRKAESLNEGIPNFVKIFKSAQNLGIAGEIYLDWLPSAYFSNLTYTFARKKLSINYQLHIDENYPKNEKIDPKVRCEEEITDPQGKIIYNRVEYIDPEEGTKDYNRSTFINDPMYWSSDSPQFYQLRLTANSARGLIAIHEQKIGLKDIEIDQQNMIVNNEQLQLKGVNYRVRYPVYRDRQNTGLSRDEFYLRLKSDFIDIKNLGFNAVRIPNIPAPPACFSLADSLGLYLFCEIGLWRIPESYFRDDKLLQISKNVADEIILFQSLHPSFTALGIGNEIPIHLAAVKKYMLILQGYIKPKFSLPLYLIPLNIDLLAQEPITDFYMFNKYDLSLLSEFNQIVNSEIVGSGAPIIISNAGFSVVNTAEINDKDAREYLQTARVQDFFKLASAQPNFNGFFLESYRDWDAAIPAKLGEPGISGTYIYPYGLVSDTNEKRDLYYQISQLMNGKFKILAEDKTQPKKSNFFSIIVFVISIAILYIYRGNYRFRENVKRSMAHPYGFFVDLRDRRIISILNSTVIGLYTNFLVSILIAAYLYYMRDNLLMEEMLSSVLVPLRLKYLYLEIIKSPFYLSLIIWFSFYILQLSVVILLKILNLMSDKKLRFKQYLATCNWAGAPLILLFPVSMLSYHLMHFKIGPPLIIGILVLFFLWYNFRLGNGLRVLLSMQVYKILILIILSYGGIIFAFGAVYEANFGLISYLKLLTEASPLF